MSTHCDLCSALGAPLTTFDIHHSNLHGRQLSYFTCDISSETSQNRDYNTASKQLDVYSGNSSLIDYCQRVFLERRETETKIECTQCLKSITIIDQEKTVFCAEILSHATEHLGKPLFVCHYCEYKAMCRAEMSLHLLEIHLNDDQEDCLNLLDGLKQEIIRMVDRCFPQKEAPLLERTTPPRPLTAVVRHCQNLYHDIWKRKGRLECQYCGRWLSVVRKERLICKIAVNHCCSHLGKILFICRFCPHRTTSESAMHGHLRKRHCLNDMPANYLYLDEYEGDIIAMIDRCFGQSGGAIQVGKTQTQISSENMIRSRFGENHLHSTRLTYALQLLKRFARDATIECRVCSHVIKLVSSWSQTQKLIWHASTHVGKPLYRCKRCQEPILVMSSVYRHMKKHHGITKNVGNEFDDLSNDVHEEIMSALGRSFDWGDASEETDSQPSDAFDRDCGSSEF